MSCTRSQGFLAKKKVAVQTQQDARKSPVAGDAALAMLRDLDDLYAVKGKRVVHVDLRDGKPDKAALQGLMLGPTGNLRAPALRKGRTLIVGFDEATYAKVFG